MQENMYFSVVRQDFVDDLKFRYSDEGLSGVLGMAGRGHWGRIIIVGRGRVRG
jgi:hypothetical protein